MSGQPVITRVVVDSPDDMADLGTKLAPMIRGRDCIGLSGDLGAGKSTLARAIVTAALAGCGIQVGDIPSPTFTLVQPYAFPDADDADREIWHLDLWRLDDPEEVIELGIEEAFSRHASLIEWPERMGPLMPFGHLMIRIVSGKHENQRLVIFSGDENWSHRLAQAGINPSE